MGRNADSPVRAVRSFVLRQGRMTESQKRAFDAYWDRWGLNESTPCFDLNSLFPEANQLVLEIGFGMGFSLVEMAVEQPDTGFIGVEVHRPGVGRVLGDLAEKQLRNVRLFCADAVEVLTHCLPADGIDKIMLLFPDPWPKKRHHKRRLLQPQFVELVHSRLKPGGVFHMATDWQNYAEHMLEVMEANPCFENINGAGAFARGPLQRPQTKFEQRGLRLGHQIYDLLYSRKS